MQPSKKPTHKSSLLAKIGRGIAIFFLSIILLLVLVLILIQTAPVQNFARKKIVVFLEKKLDTKVEIKRLDIDFPKMLVLEGVYIEDRTKDTLIAGNQLKVDIDMYKLIKSEIQINEINLNGITAKIKRQLPDTAFNFQFIIDAFATAPNPNAPKDTSALKMAIEKIIVDKTHFVYNDIVTGNDVDLYFNHFDTNIDTFDPTNLKFDVPNINLDGLRGHFKQIKPIKVTAVVANPNTAVANEKPQFLKFTNKEVNIKDIDVSYGNEVAAMSGRFMIGDMVVHPETFDLEKSLISLNEVTVNRFGGNIRMGKTGGEDVVQLTNENKQQVSTAAMPWIFKVKTLRFNENNFKMDDDTKPVLRRGMDYSHLDIKDLTLHADNFLFSNDSIAANIVKGTMSEKSGFNLKRFETNFVYTAKGAALRDLIVETPGTLLRRTAILRYPSFESLQKNIGLLEMNLDIDNSYVQVKDILTFAPQLAAQPAFRNPNTVLRINSQVTGSVSRLRIDQLQFSGLQQTRLDLSGTITGLPNPNNLYADLNIRNIQTTRADILSFAPPKSIPPNITLPNALALNGIIRGGTQKAYADLNLRTSLGSAKVTGNIANATNPASARYHARIVASNLDLGTIMQQPKNFGRVSANITASGIGFDPEKAKAKVSGVINSAQLMQYNYRNLRFDATMANQRFTANAAMKDPNLHFALNAKGDISGDLPGFSIDATIDSIKTLPLKLTPDAIVYRGQIKADFPELNLDALNGEAFLTHSLLVMNGQRIQMDSVSLLARTENNQQFIGLKTDFISAELNGQYKLQQLGTIMTEAIRPYYSIGPATKPAYVDPYNFTVNAFVIDHPALKALVPELKQMSDVSLTGNFSNVDGFNATLKAPLIVYGTNTINNLNMTATAGETALNVVTTLDGVTAGTSLNLYNTSLVANIANNQVNFGLSIKDQAAKNKYVLGGNFAQLPGENFSLSLRPDSLLLNYDPWTISGDNIIRFGSTVVNAKNFALSRNNQTLRINSVNETNNSPLEVSFNNFKLATLTGFVQSDSLIVDGTLNGNVVLNDVLTQPNFVTDLTINNLAMNKDTIGDVNAKVNNTTANVFATNVTITGRGNDVALTGNYYLKPQNNSNMDLNLAIRSLQLNTIEGATMGSIRDAKGYLSGNVKIGGTAASPDIDGRVNFNETSVIVSMLNSQFKIDDEAIVAIDNKGFRFDTFTIRDSADNRVVINGAANTTNFINYDFDLGIRARNFRALNSTKKDNPLYYGQLYFSTDMKITGTEVSPVVDGRIKINEDTKLTIVLPQTQPGVEERAGIVEFVDKDAPENDSLFLAGYDSLNQSTIMGMDISANIELDRKAELSLVIDEASGDLVKMKGEAILSGGIDKSGKVTLTGSYELDEGSYELSFNFLRRRFDIQKGSKITWSGEPTDATLDVTAVYVANTTAIELVQDQVSGASTDLRYRQKLPFEVHLNMDGELLKPVLTFDIILPEESTVRLDNTISTLVENRLAQLKSEPSELNKQVFALLLLNRFVSEDPFASAGGGFNAGSLARQSVSKILSDQLNNLAGDLIAGVDINFDLVSSEDYTSGSLQNRTDLNVGLSKRLLNDRLTVTVGTQFELEGAQQTNQSGATSTSPNINLAYNLTRDGRYLIRAYRKNEYEGVIEGYVIETGVGFVVNVDYNKFQEIFQRRKGRQANAANRERRQKDESKPAPEKPANAPLKSPATTANKENPAIDKVRNDEDEY